MSNLTVTRNDELSRYELHDAEADALAGFAEFEQGEGRVRFTHTVVDPAFRDRGYGDVLTSEALSDVARRGDVIVPLCPFVASYLKQNEVAGAIVQWPHGTPHDAATPGEQSS
ncbi:GNAT family N-acetyltransferase [Microbacterium betulae]|uniref:GNAT family N-acetyltransferase n=1 Tax=Microbacterium betulae TaxID=2981139 RepID=A0AA97FFI5_9MICO|nr:GNAT family N-acetyltransferase [Microbacterium sp. AB]WOF22676.1 GNAT family N-acetyltransferase [Microbacterium sp. AB]